MQINPGVFFSLFIFFGIIFSFGYFKSWFFMWIFIFIAGVFLASAPLQPPAVYFLSGSAVFFAAGFCLERYFDDCYHISERPQGISGALIAEFARSCSWFGVLFLVLIIFGGAYLVAGGKVLI